MKILVFVAALLMAAPAAAQVNGVQLDAPEALPEFALTDHFGRDFSKQNLQGGWSMVMLGFTYCPDVCPFTLGNLEHVVAEMSLRVRPQNLPKVIFLSVDPDRDREGLKDYTSYFHPDFIGVTGDKPEIDTLVEGLDAFYRFVPKGEDYEVQHSASVSVIDPDGMLRAKLQPPFDPGPTAEFLSRIQIEYRKEAAK